MQSLRDDRNRHLFWLLSLSMALTIGAAQADQPKSKSITQPSELMKFDHVQVINAPAATPPKTNAKSSAPAMRAYVNGDLEISSASAAQASQLNSDTASVQTESDTPQLVPGAGTIAAVGDNLAVFQVAHKVSTGLVVQEMTGKGAAEKAIAAGPTTRATAGTEVSNER